MELTKKQSSSPEQLQNIDVLVKEPISLRWEPETTISPRGVGSELPNCLLFRVAARLLRIFKSQYQWHFFHSLDQNFNTNSIVNHPAIVDKLEELFKQELQSSYSPEQLDLLFKSQILMIAVEKKSGEIVGYCSGRIHPKSASDFSIPVVFGCHEIVSSGHQRAKLGVAMASLLLIYGRKVSEAFDEMAIVVRSNNKHIFRPLKQCGRVYRSDEMSEAPTEYKNIVKYMHCQVFGLSSQELPLDKPMEITHFFEEKVRIDGVGGNQIIYVLGITSLVKSVFKLLARRRRS